jgi:SAM-dependent methyltransferase
MFTDIIELREFYQSPRGRAAAALLAPVTERLLARHQAAGSVHGAVHVAYGYAPPSLFATPPTAMLMPAAQGVCSWPDTSLGGRLREPQSVPECQNTNRAVLVEESAWPLPADNCDSVVLMHALESCTSPAHVLAEAWRVLKSSGRLIIITPNRRGLWARAEGTPFGRGQPFTALQLRMLLRQTQFVAEQWERAVFIPPVKSSASLASANVWERLGRVLAPNFGGVLVMAAAKQLYAPSSSSGNRAPAHATRLVMAPSA